MIPRFGDGTLSMFGSAIDAVKAAVEIQKELLPEHKIWADCIKCKHFPICNEVSLIKNL